MRDLQQQIRDQEFQKFGSEVQAELVQIRVNRERDLIMLLYQFQQRVIELETLQSLIKSNHSEFLRFSEETGETLTKMQ